MTRRRTICLAAATALLLSGCAGMFNREYVSVSEYVPTAQENVSTEDRVTVKNFAALKQALLNFAYEGDETGIIVFDPSYDGDTTEDMASACWQVRTGDALCAYCVENIAYEINKIVTINEANVYISYTKYGEAAENIERLYFSSGLEGRIREALSEGKRRMAVLVSQSIYGAEDIAGLVTQIYREDPTITPKQPTVRVNMFSGSGQQRLYELGISYGMTDEEMARRMTQLEQAKPFKNIELKKLGDAERAYAACTYLAEHSVIDESKGGNTAYAALVENCANSEGMAFAYVELCRELDVSCMIVYGQKFWENCCWNIVEIDGSYYHVDVAGVMRGELESSFLMNDEQFWASYRWDVASYPKCAGELDYSAVETEAE